MSDISCLHEIKQIGINIYLNHYNWNICKFVYLENNINLLVSICIEIFDDMYTFVLNKKTIKSHCRVERPTRPHFKCQKFKNRTTFNSFN